MEDTGERETQLSESARPADRLKDGRLHGSALAIDRGSRLARGGSTCAAE
jgi:hypothetical protein